VRLTLPAASLVSVAVLAVGASAAPAAVTVSSFSAAPTPLQAGFNADLPLKADIATSDADDVKDLTLSLATGVLANPNIPATCAKAQFDADSCAAGTQVGSGTLTVNTPGGDVAAAARIFQVEPTAVGGLPRLGLDASALGQRLTVLGDVGVRTAPDVGLNFTFKDIPNTLGGADITITKIDVKLDGTVGGKPFTRNPTACTAHKTTASIVSYKVSTPVTADSTFTPTGCDALAFTPALTASAAIAPGTDGVELTTTVAQPLGEAAQKQSLLTLPAEIGPRVSALTRACTEADILKCPASATVGSASIETPLLPVPLPGKVVIKSQPGALPLLVIVLPPPLPLQIVGSPGLALTGQTTTTFDNLPDAPITKLTVTLNGGADSVLQARSGLCTGAKTVGGTFAAHSGKTANVNAPLPVSGTCPSASTPPPPPPPPAATPTGKLSFSGLAKTPRLVASLSVPSGAAAAKKLKLTLPSGLSVVKKRLAKGLKVTAGGRTVKVKTSSTSRSLTITLPSAASSVKVTLGGGALKASSSLKKKVRAKKAGRLKLTLKAVDGTGKATTLSLGARAK
jgi:hypothetical protein